jgi:hypothetical protein
LTSAPLSAEDAALGQRVEELYGKDISSFLPVVSAAGISRPVSSTVPGYLVRAGSLPAARAADAMLPNDQSLSGKLVAAAFALQDRISAAPLDPNVLWHGLSPSGQGLLDRSAVLATAIELPADLPEALTS